MTPIPDWLETELQNHGQAYELYYNGFLADHFPMAALALHALGGSELAVRDFAKVT